MILRKVRRALYLFTFISVALLVVLAAIYLRNIRKINKIYFSKYSTKSPVALRKFPYPFRTAMTICSDIDGTTTKEEFIEIQRFLTTTEMTSMGRGIGLEIGNSFLMYAPPTCCISYFSGDPENARIITRFTKSGQIDVMHSYGEKQDFTRNDAIEALKELTANDCKVDVWVDHTKSIDNFGDDVTFGKGDHPNSTVYHADLTVAYGLKFVWLGRVTMMAGQSAPITVRTFTNIFDIDHPIHSLINISKEFAKNFLAVFGNKKYAMHKNNDLVRVKKLDDGQKVYEFMRFDNYWQGVSIGAKCRRLAYVISKKTLNRLKENSGYMIVYTHLGMNSDCSQSICKETQNALRNLAEEYRQGNIYVTTTSKLLNYYITHKYLNWSYEFKDGETIIHIYNVQDPVFGSFVPIVQDLKGFTFYIPTKSKVRIYINNKEIEHTIKNPPDYTGSESLTIFPRTFVRKKHSGREDENHSRTFLTPCTSHPNDGRCEREPT